MKTKPLDVVNLGVRAAILNAERENEFVLTDEQRELLVSQCRILLMRGASKWVAGQKEHGGDIRKRDLKREIVDEAVDLFFYGVSLPDEP